MRVPTCARRPSCGAQVLAVIQNYESLSVPHEAAARSGNPSPPPMDPGLRHSSGPYGAPSQAIAGISPGSKKPPPPPELTYVLWPHAP